MIGVIVGKELRSLLFTPLGWAVLAINALTQGLIFYRLIQAYQAHPVVEGAQAGVSYNIVALLCGSSAYIALLLIPVLTMGLFSAERSRGTWPFWASAPVRDSQLVLGKYFAVLVMIALMLAVSAAMAMSLADSTIIDWGMVLCAWLGAFLTLAAYAAIGTWISALAASPAVAGAVTLFALLLFWLFELLGTTGVQMLDRGVAYLSIFAHLEPFLRGQLNSTDLVYFALAIVLPLVLAGAQVRRLRGMP